MSHDTVHPAVLFTAFEPSGDDHAASVITELKKSCPDLVIYGWGGRKMEAAGAQIIEFTGDDAVMGMPGLAKIKEHQRMNAEIEEWLKDHDIKVHVPVDSPAANFPVCKLTKASGARIVHMVAPQLWAWAPWRIRKLRRLTDHVMCVLPFEEAWFKSRGVEATFVGHPLFDSELDTDLLDEQIKDWPKGDQKIALMPGSRPGEIRKNFPLLLGAYIKLANEHPNMRGLVAATREDLEPVLRKIGREAGLQWPDSLDITYSNTDAVIRWCDLSIVVSGTVTLQIAKQHRPMVIVYKLGRVGWTLIARWLIQTKFITLPNLIAGREIVPEMVPHFGGAEPIADRVVELLEDADKFNEQIQQLEEIGRVFESENASKNAARIIANYAGVEIHSGNEV
ncbi:MAG: lipid-A-disaccharide synthase [Phycisphaerales bacterium]|nr:lipid-A-disaccharide synthase [Phycisphaerales bacterium]